MSDEELAEVLANASLLEEGTDHRYLSVTYFHGGVFRFWLFSIKIMTTTAARATILTRRARYLKKLLFLSFNMSFTAEMKTEEEEEERAATPPAGDSRSRAPTPNSQNPGPVGDNEALTRASPTGPTLPNVTAGIQEALPGAYPAVTNPPNHPPMNLTPVVSGNQEALTRAYPGTTNNPSPNPTPEGNTSASDGRGTPQPRDKPKGKGERDPLSEKARVAKRAKETAKRRVKRQAAAEAKRKNGPAAAPNPPAPNNQPRPTQRTPAEVFGSAVPTHSLAVTRQGAGASAREQISMSLMLADENYTVVTLRPAVDGAVIEVGDGESLRVVTAVLEADGWTVVQSPVWARYSFIIPEDYRRIPLERLVQALLRRNGRGVRGPEGIPDNSIRGVSTAVEGGEGTGSPQRMRGWVDVSPEAEQYLLANDRLLRTVSSGIRLRPAPRSRPSPDGS